MKRELSIAEKLSYSTIRITSSYEDKGVQYCTSGTGFFYNIHKPDYITIPVIITNKHVISGLNHIELLFNVMDERRNPIENEYIDVEYDITDIVKMHPDKDVDLCAIPFAPIINNMDNKLSKPVYYHSLEKGMLPSKEQIKSLYAGEEVFMIGYPDALYDKYNNKPIFRKGITATAPKLNYNNQKEFLCDIQIYNGSSGSPIVIMHTDISNHSKKITLLGIAHATHQHLLQENVACKDGDHIKYKNLYIPNGLPHVIKAERILELETLF